MAENNLQIDVAVVKRGSIQDPVIAREDAYIATDLLGELVLIHKQDRQAYKSRLPRGRAMCDRQGILRALYIDEEAIDDYRIRRCRAIVLLGDTKDLVDVPITCIRVLS